MLYVYEEDGTIFDGSNHVFGSGHQRDRFESYLVPCVARPAKVPTDLDSMEKTKDSRLEEETASKYYNAWLCFRVGMTRTWKDIIS